MLSFKYENVIKQNSHLEKNNFDLSFLWSKERKNLPDVWTGISYLLDTTVTTFGLLICVLVYRSQHFNFNITIFTWEKTGSNCNFFVNVDGVSTKV